MSDANLPARVTALESGGGSFDDRYNVTLGTNIAPYIAEPKSTTSSIYKFDRYDGSARLNPSNLGGKTMTMVISDTSSAKLNICAYNYTKYVYGPTSGKSPGILNPYMIVNSASVSSGTYSAVMPSDLSSYNYLQIYASGSQNSLYIYITSLIFS